MAMAKAKAMAMVPQSLLLLLVAILSSHWMLTTTAFSTTVTAVGRATPAPLVRVTITCAQAQQSADVVPADRAENATNTHPAKENASAKEKAAIIFLHGLGDCPDGWSSLAEALPTLRPSLAALDITYVFPPAQTIGITVNGGEKMLGWFDIFDWPIGVDAKDDPKGLAMSVKRIEKIVAQLQDEEGIDPSRVVLGGFSQGGAVAITAAYNRRRKDAVPFAGCVCMSGWLPMKGYLEVSAESAAATPLFWAHGQYDDKILFEQQQCGVHKLEGVGVDVTARSYPVGHESSNLEEIDEMAGFLEAILCPDAQAATVAKSAHVDKGAEGSVSVMDDDDINALLYYLCAIGMDENNVINESIPSAATFQ